MNNDIFPFEEDWNEKINKKHNPQTINEISFMNSKSIHKWFDGLKKKNVDLTRQNIKKAHYSNMAEMGKQYTWKIKK